MRNREAAWDFTNVEARIGAKKPNAVEGLNQKE